MTTWAQSSWDRPSSTADEEGGQHAAERGHGNTYPQMAGQMAGHHTLSRNSSMIEEEREMLLKRQEAPGWRVDRGAGFYQEERIRNKRACLVETGRHAGRSRVKREGIQWAVMMKHILKRDFFNAAVNAKLYLILLALCVVYSVTILAWAVLYFLTWRIHPDCFLGFTGPVSALLFSVETQQTIGYGTRSPNDCWEAAILIAVHSLVALLLDSMILGIAFARISHPKNRGRTILISDSAVVSRRDGTLTFMFRVADIQKSQVVAPRIQCFMYTWGEGHTTAEGERIPVQVQDLRLQWDHTLLLPTTVEHIIDETSPLYGMNQKTLENLGAEMVVEFEGSTELGDMFMVRQSYLAHELHWGHCFTCIISRAAPGETEHTVDLSRFHDVEPLPGLEALPPHKLSAKVVAPPPRCLPPPTLHQNTLVLSDEGLLGSRDSRLFLQFRIGDTYPAGQVEEVRVEAFLHRWQMHVTAEGEAVPFTVEELVLHPRNPSLRYPVVVTHEIREGSPIAHWNTLAGKRLDADTEIIVTVKGILAGHRKQRLVSRSRWYQVHSIKWGATFLPMVTRLPTPGYAHIDWPAFHLSTPSEVLIVPTLSTAPSRDDAFNRAPSHANLQALPLSPQATASAPAPDAARAAAEGARSRLEKSTSSLPPLAPHAHSSGGAGAATSAAAALLAGGSGAGAAHQQQAAQDKPKKGLVPLVTQPSRSSSSSSTFSRSQATGQAGAEETWKDTRSLFAAIQSMNELVEAEAEAEAEAQQEQGQDG